MADTHSRIYARATGWQISRGGILKKIKIEIWYAEKKRLLFCILETHYNVLSFVSFLCCFCLHITEYEQIMGGAQNFLGPRGIKYLNTGLLTPVS